MFTRQMQSSFVLERIVLRSRVTDASHRSEKGCKNWTIVPIRPIIDCEIKMMFVKKPKLLHRQIKQ